MSVQFVDSPTERTTAATDAALAIECFLCAVYLTLSGSTDLWKVAIWSGAFCLLATAAALGAIVHGLIIPPTWHGRLWHGLRLCLGLGVALFLGGLLHDVGGAQLSKWGLPLLLLVGGGFFLLTVFTSTNFVLFIIYELLALLIALGGYGWLAWQGNLPGVTLILVGLILTLGAAIIQAKRLMSFTLIWPFDHNGVFHLVQLVANLWIFLGVVVSLG